MRNVERDAPSPVSFPVNVARLPKKGMPVVIEADARQREALARAHGLTGVESFRAELEVEPWKRNGIRVSGRVRAVIGQECIVTLDPLVATIDEPVEGLFLPEDSKLGRLGFEAGGEIMLDADGPDAPELFSGDTIDVGALAEEFFGLGIDPYPRRAGVAMPDAPAADAQAPGGRSEEPAAVAEWQQKLRGLVQKG